MEIQAAKVCALCGAPATDAPRLYVRQKRHLDADRTHEIPLCEEHGYALRAGVLPPQRIIYDWVTRAHDALYENARLVLRPELRCLGCNAPLKDVPTDLVFQLDCATCEAGNVLGTALGHRVAVKLGAG